MSNYIQTGIFDIIEEKEKSVKEMNEEPVILLDEDDIRFFDNYDLDKYQTDVKDLGLSITWQRINTYVLLLRNKNKFLDVNNFAELYEIGLALENKYLKKENGQYYTPDDIANVMSNWFNNINGENICDVACGTGRLILTYLDVIGEKTAKKILSEGRLYLYDLDGIALSICKTILLVKYGVELSDCIHDIHCDFLDSKIKLPNNSKVISNPPYAGVKVISSTWERTQVTVKTKELYAMFMEKIIDQSMASVIITPYSFIGADKFYPLRLMMNDHSGFIVCFDNVPGNIFCGRKHGIFNTNTANSVRAAITVVNNTEEEKGFRLTPLLRFKSDERALLLKNDVLEKYIADKHQLVDKKNFAYEKCHKELQELLEIWKTKSDSTIKDIITAKDTEYTLYMPNTCRYFTTGAKRKLNRTGMIKLNFNDEKSFNLAYCIINSSFAYWWWRIYDGGITYPIGLLKKMPIKFSSLDEKAHEQFREIVQEMISVEETYITTKLNAGVEQENIKFPEKYRNRINKLLLDIYGYSGERDLFEPVHSNNMFGEIK